MSQIRSHFSLTSLNSDQIRQVSLDVTFNGIAKGGPGRGCAHPTPSEIAEILSIYSNRIVS